MLLLFETIPLVLVFAVGACVGSFLNVVIYRLPAGLSLVKPGSHCPACNHGLGPTENVPIAGWLWLKGKCRWCGVNISPRYPLIETVTGILFTAIALRYGFTWVALGYTVLVSFFICLALIDLDTLTLPRPLTKWGLILGVIYQTLISGSNPIEGFIGATTGAVVALWLLDTAAFLGSALLGKKAMGGGDPKLLAMIGAWLGLPLALLTLVLACGFGIVIGGTATWAERKIYGRSPKIPFGPFLTLGAMVSMMAGQQIMDWYLTINGLTL